MENAAKKQSESGAIDALQMFRVRVWYLVSNTGHLDGTSKHTAFITHAISYDHSGYNTVLWLYLYLGT